MAETEVTEILPNVMLSQSQLAVFRAHQALIDAQEALVAALVRRVKMLEDAAA